MSRKNHGSSQNVCAMPDSTNQQKENSARRWTRVRVSPGLSSMAAHGVNRAGSINSVMYWSVGVGGSRPRFTPTMQITTPNTPNVSPAA